MRITLGLEDPPPTLDVMADEITTAADTYNTHLPDNQTTPRTRAEIAALPQSISSKSISRAR